MYSYYGAQCNSLPNIEDPASLYAFGPTFAVRDSHTRSSRTAASMLKKHEIQSTESTRLRHLLPCDAALRGKPSMARRGSSGFIEQVVEAGANEPGDVLLGAVVAVGRGEVAQPAIEDSRLRRAPLAAPHNGMGVAHRAARVGLLVERGEHLHALEGIGVDRVVEELVVHAQLVGEAAERGGLVPRTRHATVQHHAARLRRRVVDEVRAEDLLDHARGVAERGGAARILPVEEGGEARVQPEHGEPLLEVARERLARGVEDLPRVVDEDDQVVPRRRGQLELRRVVRDDGAPPLLGEQRADVRRG
eukprot:CAMPEP_0184380418 /NCGR_PEP_ID=MMETSP0007-20130409/4725_1 /TAXON_ID=97485 /ORGANISM="Prymnesium parvum, Strain Texoma1" /LENGTH=304 /DNA_ID=CAMNT_0026725635 /DNA_START=103 /DNA_END=1015 /DNA_ORIENTATION=+